MADYYKILTGAIAQQGVTDQPGRQVLYDRVRKVLDSQLAGLDGEKSAPIAVQHRKILDDAIAKIEAEAGASAVPDANPPAEEPVTPVEPTASDISTEPTTPPAAAPIVGPASKTDTLPDPATPVSDADKASGAPDDNKGATPPPAPGSYVAPPLRPGPAVSAAPPPRPSQNEMSRQMRPSLAGENRADDTRPKRRMGKIFLIFLILLGGLTVLGYWQRDNLGPTAGPIMQSVGDIAGMAKDRLGALTGLWQPSSSSPMAETSNENPDEPSATDTNGEGTVQNDNGDEPGDEPDQTQTGEPDPSAPVASNVTTQTPVVENTESNNAPEAADNPDPATPVVEEPASPAPAPVAAGPVLPQAFFLMEGNEAEGLPDERIDGQANWLLVGNGSNLRVEAELDGTGGRLVLDIEKNNDVGLPATHTITYTFIPGEANSENPIVDFPAFMTRVDDTSQSVPLRGVGALILPNQFLMGLSSKPEDVPFNMDLLKNARWFVIPVVFENERRGLFVIEKGQTGRDAFAAVSVAWGEAGDPQ